MNLNLNRVNETTSKLESVADCRNYTLIEEFSGIQKIDEQNEKDHEELQGTVDEFNRALSKYSTSHRALLDKANRFVETTSNNKYSGKNVRLKDGTMGYVTERGFFKEYPSKTIMDSTAGKNGCPSSSYITNIDAISNGETISSDPELIVGTPMISNQPCGNEGTNIEVTSMQSDTTPSWQGCYTYVEGSGLEYQSDLSNSATLRSCKTRAQDLGYSVFSLSNGTKESSKCYVGNDIKSATSGGVSTKRLVSYEVLKGNGSKGGILMNGQLGLATGNKDNFTIRKFKGDDKCDVNKGGFLNKSDTIATYGANCHGKMKNISFLNQLI